MGTTEVPVCVCVCVRIPLHRFVRYLKRLAAVDARFPTSPPRPINRRRRTCGENGAERVRKVMRL